METEAVNGKINLSYFGDVSGDLWEAYIDAAKTPPISETTGFYHTDDVACGEKFGLSGSGVALSRGFDNSPIQYAGEKDFFAMVDWVQAASIPNVITFSEEYIDLIFGEHKPFLAFFTEETGTEQQEAFVTAAKELRGEILFVTSGATNEAQKRLTDYLVVTNDLPCMFIVNPKSDGIVKYKFETPWPWNTDTLKSFIDGFKEGTITRHYKSQPIPEANDGSLTVLVGNNWEKIVLDGTKDVLVDIYSATMCPPCRALEPLW